MTRRAMKLPLQVLLLLLVCSTACSALTVALEAVTDVDSAVVAPNLKDSVASASSLSAIESDPPHASVIHAASLALRAATLPVEIALYTGLSNELFADYLCNNMSAGEAVTLAITARDAVGMWLVPECFYQYCGSLNIILATNIVLAGATTEPDGLLRLVKAAPSLTTLQLFSTNAAGTSSTPTSWTAFFDATPSLNALLLDSVTLGPGTPLFESLPARFTNGVRLRNCGLTGAIASNFLSQIGSSAASFWLDLSMNALTGNVPDGLFASINMNAVISFELYLGFNSFEGLLPTSFLPSSLPSLESFALNLTHNRFEGNLQPLLSSSMFAPGSLYSVALDFGDNMFTGTIPNDWFTGVLKPGISAFAFLASNNRLNGTIPADFLSGLDFTAQLSVLTFDVAGNQLFGDIPTAFLDLHPSSPMDFFGSAVTLDVSRNALNGTIPVALFANLNWTRSTFGSFNFSRNELVGGVPANLLNESPTPYLGHLIADFSFNPKMAGSVPSNFLPSLADPQTTFYTYGTIVYVSFANTSLTGALVLPLRDRAQSLGLYLLAANANFGSLSYNDLSTLYLIELDISNNRRLTGTITPSFLPPQTRLSSFRADNTLLSGVMPNIDSTLQDFAVFSLVGTSIDFCGTGNRPVWTSSALSTCALNGTNAINCRSKYPSICTFSDSECLASTRPSPDFVCLNGGWVYIGNLNTTVITLPSGSTTTTVIGNVSSSEIVINGVGSNLVIEGCAANLSHVTIVLTAEDLKNLSSQALRQKLVSIGNNCSQGLENVQVNVNIKGGSCKKVKAKSNFANGSLSTILTLDTSGCRTWWIILVSVIAAVVVLAAVVFALLVIFVPSVRHFVRPYSKRARVET